MLKQNILKKIQKFNFTLDHKNALVVRLHKDKDFRVKLTFFKFE